VISLNQTGDELLFFLKILTYRVVEFPVSLARLSLSQELAIPQRQLAAVTLKQYIESHWSSKNEKFVGPEPPEEVR